MLNTHIKNDSRPGSIYIFTLVLMAAALLTTTLPAFAQQSVGIGTTTPDPKAALDITSTTKGVLFPRLTIGQQAILAGMLSSAEKGMMVTDATTGKLVSWTGSTWVVVPPAAPLTAAAPLSLTTNNIQMNPGTNKGDLLSWDGNNWVNTQPAVQHFSYTFDNHQPYLVTNYIISAFGIFPSQNDAQNQFVGEITLFGGNFAPTGWFLCQGQLLPISQWATLFNLIGTTYGGDGQTTFALPDLRGRIPVHEGSNGGSTYVIGQTGGTEQKTFAH